MGELDIRPLPRVLLRDELDPDPMAERLLEMFRRWKRGELPDLEEEPENQTEHG